MPRFLAFRERAVEASTQDEPDELLSFSPETGLTASAPKPPASRRISPRALLTAVLFLSVFALGAISAVFFQAAPLGPSTASPSRLGTAIIASQPEGAEVLVNGIARGTTPLEVKLEGGEHQVQLQKGSVTRTFTLAIVAGERTTQYVELAAAAAVQAVGRLEVSSEPPGARVTVDGEPRGTTPLTLEDIAPGSHRVVISSGSTSLQRTVRVEGGSSASVAVSLAPAGQPAGWLTFAAPFEMQVIDRGVHVGSTVADRLMVPAGRRDLELLNATLGFRHTVNVDVAAGRLTTVSVPIPNGSLSINALPWAEVSVDGRSVGTTPLANLSVPIGQHVIVWRHPRLGERRQTVTVTTQEPARIGVDFSQ